MAIEVGGTLLHYRLVEKLGEGGMGVVWRAIDSTLEREVAIKLLPDALATDAERLARFQREARLLAAVNHPNIAAVYSVHEHDGRRFLAMELVPGEDLAARLSRGPVPPKDAIAIARQVAEALEAAHESGVVHRDLKPANVRLTPGGRVKVLDFGLAKSLEPASAAPGPGSASLSPTVTSAGSVAGLLLGTAAYMSPEQARGQAVDRRADIWAFGCLLHELLSGRQAFGGTTVSDTLAAVLVKEPDWSALPAGLPRAVPRLIARCLDKDARTRLRDIGEARIALAAPAEREEEPVSPQRGARRWPERLLWLAALALVAVALTRRGADSDAHRRASDAPPGVTMRRLTELPGPELHPSLSPDGRMLAYDSAASGNGDVYLLRVGGDRAINLTADSPADDRQASFAPDGDRIAFRSERDGGGLFVMGATGESVRRVTDTGFDPAWSPDGARLSFATHPVTDPYVRIGDSELWIVDIGSGHGSRLVETDAVQPAWSPTGERIAYWANTGGQRDIWTVAAAGGEPLAVTQDPATDWSPAWSPDGRWLYFSSDRGGSMSLWRVPLDPATGVTEGPPRPFAPGTRGMAHAGFSADGRRMVVMAYDRTYDVTLYEMLESPALAARPLTTLRRQSSGGCRPSPDGIWLACFTTGAQEDIVVQRADGSELRRLMDDPPKDRIPVWSPDGESITFRSTRSGEWQQWWIRADGSGLRQLTGDADPIAGGRGVFSPDGRRLAFGKDLIDLDRPATPASATQLVIPLPGADLLFMPGAWSPDGTRLAGGLARPGRLGEAGKVALFDFARGTLRVLDVDTSRLMLAVGGWFPDSRRLLLATPGGAVVYDTATDARRTLLDLRPGASVALSANGKVLLAEESVLDSEIWLLTLD